MKAKAALDVDALVAEAVPPRYNPQLAFTIPLRVYSEANERIHWGKKVRRKNEQQQAIHIAWKKAVSVLGPASTPCVVRLTRVGSQALDSDNLAISFKACRDQIAHELGIDDGSESVKWEYAQVAVGRRVYAIRVEVS